VIFGADGAYGKAINWAENRHGYQGEGEPMSLVSTQSHMDAAVAATEAKVSDQVRTERIESFFLTLAGSLAALAVSAGWAFLALT